MAGEARDRGLTLAETLGVLRRNWLIVASCVVLALTAVVIQLLTASPVYRAEASMYISVRSAASDSLLDLTQGGSYARQAVVSYADVITSPIVLDRVVSDIGLEETSNELARSVTSSSPDNSVLINVAVERSDPDEAALVANSITENFTHVVEEVIEKPPDGGTSAVQVTTIRDARPPASPVGPATTQSILLGLAIGTIAGVAGAFLRTALSTRIRTVEDVRRNTAIPVIGEIIADTGPEKHALVVHDDPRNPKAETFRSLRTNLQFINVDGRPRSFLITSSGPDEGKSTVSCNLAVSLAQTGASVALVDGDLRKPIIAHYMGVDPVVGLSNVLAGLVTLDDALQHWRDLSLTVLAAGRIPPNPSELLSSAEMAKLQTALISRFDYVIVDSPPVLAVSDAAVIAGLTGSTIVVVASGRSRGAGLLATIESLESVTSHISGIVLTGVSARGSSRLKYGYGRYRAEESVEHVRTPRVTGPHLK